MMKLVYVAHPLTGDEEGNKRKAREAIKLMQEQHPDTAYVNPLDNFSYAKDDEYCDVLARCERLLTACDAAVFCEGWEESAGCRSEMALCRFFDIPYAIL